MTLTVTTPFEMLVREEGIVHLRAEDASGAFGVLTGHEALLTILVPTVVSWRTEEGRQGHCAVRGGLLTVEAGSRIGIATRDGVVGDSLEDLERRVVDRFRRADEAEAAARVSAEELHLAALRRMIGLLGGPRSAGERR